MRLNIEMKEEIYGKLQALADDEGRSVSDVVRVLVNSWVESKEKKNVRAERRNKRNQKGRI